MPKSAKVYRITDYMLEYSKISTLAAFGETTRKCGQTA